MLLRAADEGARVLERLVECVRDHRNPLLLEHTVEELVRQRVYGPALGHEDLVPTTFGARREGDTDAGGDAAKCRWPDSHPPPPSGHEHLLTALSIPPTIHSQR